jgi:hypothetical protein
MDRPGGPSVRMPWPRTTVPEVMQTVREVSSVPVDNNRIARWLESLQVVRVTRLEREEATPQLTTLYFRDTEGSVHTVLVNPDGTPREYKDPKGHVHQYNTRYKPPAQPAPVVAAGPATTAAPSTEPRAPARAAMAGGRSREAPAASPETPSAVTRPPQATARPGAEGTARPTVGPAAQSQPSRTPIAEAKAAPVAAPAAAPSQATRPPKAGDEPPAQQERKGLEEVVIEWAEKNQGLSGVSVVRREISTKGITFRLKGNDGAEYEAITGMDQHVKSFRKL